jgi:tetratricopeptide (TPR) repeat protein
VEEATYRQPQPVQALSGVVAIGAALVLSLGAVGPAWADEKPLSAKEKRAGELFELADTHYAAGRYEQAAKYFEEGYELAPHPEFLYSLGNTYERMGKYAQAADFLERYIKSPLAEDVVSVKERIKRLEAAAEARRLELERMRVKNEARQKEPDGDLGDDGPVDDEPRSTSNAHYYWFGGAAVGGAAAATFGLLSRQAATAASGACSDGLCESSARSDLDREKRYALIADISLGLAVGAAVVGVIELVRNRPGKRAKKRSALRLEPMIAPDGAGVGVAASF